ncbi:MAG: phenylalanine--tRNA ligase subunit alpha [Cuniculiplasma divulgatum]|nr:MAG: phenylalanine--tRNA ligase subunit alpha [Cuniculiplasma divulgatum]
MADNPDSYGKEQFSSDVSPNEVKVLNFLSQRKEISEAEISIEGLGQREISSAISWLESKKLIDVSRKDHTEYSLTDEGEKFLLQGLPEEKAMQIIRNGHATVRDVLQTLGPSEGKIALAQLAKLGIKPSGGLLPAPESSVFSYLENRRQFLEKIKKGEEPPDQEILEHFRKRENVIKERKRTIRMVRINPAGIRVLEANSGNQGSIGALTSDIIQSGSWKTIPFQRYDMNSRVERILGAGIHPISFLSRMVREIFLDLGFTEMSGHYIEHAAWNMDALFIPQDHPARDMQDTFYIDSSTDLEMEHPEVLEIFRKVHEKGIKGYTGWGYRWSSEKAAELLLRTHTTVSTIRYLYEHKQAPQAVFSVEKVFRHESVDWKHLAELHQIEGAYYGKDASLASLKWLMKEFYRRLGFTELRFIPSYYPYTEPSMDVMVTINGKEMELGGSGVFRPEVTRPLGLKHPVIAWGLGLERLAMIYFGLDDIRDIYQSDLDWLRSYRVKI